MRLGGRRLGVLGFPPMAGRFGVNILVFLIQFKPLQAPAGAFDADEQNLVGPGLQVRPDAVDAAAAVVAVEPLAPLASSRVPRLATNVLRRSWKIHARDT